MELQQCTSLLIPGLLAYMFLVFTLRHQRSRGLERKYSPMGKASFRTMTTNDAQAILEDLAVLEFPNIFGFSIVFALFKARNLTNRQNLFLVSVLMLES